MEPEEGPSVQAKSAAKEATMRYVIKRFMITFMPFLPPLSPPSNMHCGVIGLTRRGKRILLLTALFIGRAGERLLVILGRFL
jgi:hypothetical protein